MNTTPACFQLSLAKRTIFTLPDAAGVEIECRSGSVWVTVDHDLRDIVLAPGERFEGDQHRRLLVSALEPSCITVSGPQPAVPTPQEQPARSLWRLRSHGMSPA
ncbi:hypothetical protein H4CHR_05654 [Variovorax sp. PBS-H4]|uniref:DUF2917 domain-containing protein n=1 Tax=Variovorax sp. PBS-H4 TaxID=434008 RepID=UPI001316CDAF|nr:DUF2917 domain-containing protein [Variovorax sp. PBS-H4]VTU40921.1 hypothetical protein H4CHR_05654 [Variovorax sp. PBS-H4]